MIKKTERVAPLQPWHSDYDLNMRLDDLENEDFEETEEEKAEFEERVRKEIELRLGHRSPPPPSSAPAAAPSPPVLVSATPDHVTSSPRAPSSPSASAPAIPSGLAAMNTLGLETTPAALSTSRPISTPRRMLTAPTIETPDMTAPLPRPPPTRVLPSHLTDTPINVPTPQTPEVVDRSVVGQGRRDDLATPLANAVYEKLKTKTEYQKITKHIENVRKALAPAPAAGSSRGRGRGGRLGMGARARIGGQVMKGLRFCLPPDDPKTKNRAEIVSFHCTVWSDARSCS